MLTLTLGLPISAKGSTVGLTGTYDDDTENDLTYLNGTGHISINSTESELFDWASTCKSPQQIVLLFDYAAMLVYVLKRLWNGVRMAQPPNPP